MLMPIRELSVSVDDFELCAYWRLGRLRYQTLRIHEDQVVLKRVKACLPSSLACGDAEQRPKLQCLN
jgi:hypothetical protein